MVPLHLTDRVLTPGVNQDAGFQRSFIRFQVLVYSVPPNEGIIGEVTAEAGALELLLPGDAPFGTRGARAHVRVHQA